MDTMKSSKNEAKHVTYLDVKESIEKLCSLAARFRGYYGNPERQEQFISEYLMIFDQLAANGGTEFLDIECLLPDEYLPESFVKQLGFAKK